MIILEGTNRRFSKTPRKAFLSNTKTKKKYLFALSNIWFLYMYDFLCVKQSKLAFPW